MTSGDQQIRTSEEKQAAEDQIIDLSKRIDFYLTEYSVEHLATKMQNGEYVVPSYQRAFTWEPDRKSRFIESLLLGLPVPFIFFWEMPDGKLEVVDGSQRLRTLQEFLFGNLRLGDLARLTKVAGMTFAELPESRQRKVGNRSIRGIILNEHADEAARFDMFERINTGSKIANSAEVRRGALAGKFLDLVVELSMLELFTGLAPMKKKGVEERGREELVARFFAYGDGLDKYKDEDNPYKDNPSEFIFKYSKKMNAEFVSSPELADEYRKRFVETMTFISRVFPYGFRKSARGTTTYRARFEAIAIGSYVALTQNPALKDVPASKLNTQGWAFSEDFQDVTGSDGANARARLTGRIEYVREKLAEAAKA